MTQPSKAKIKRVSDRAATHWRAGHPHQAYQEFANAHLAHLWPTWQRGALQWARTRYRRAIHHHTGGTLVTVILAAILAVTTALGPPVPPASANRGPVAFLDARIAWHEHMLHRGWQPSPNVWYHPGCWQLPGDTTYYRCADGFEETS